ncbi:hypothetical protein REPUB_Repub16aG0106800 [Reevesia pubescens]
MESNLDQSQPLGDDSNSILNKENRQDREAVPSDENGVACQNLKTDMLESFESSKLDRTRSSPNGIMSPGHVESDRSESGKLGEFKRSNEDMDANDNNKKVRTVFIASDDEADSTVKDELIFSKLDYRTLPEKNGDAVEVESDSSQCLTEKFNCTACHKVAIKVQQHLLLKVIMCMDCKCLLEEKIHTKDSKCSECYCGWCGQSNDLASGWQCYRCLPSLLQKLTSELERAMGSQDTMVSSSDSESENSDAYTNTAISSKRKRKKKIRRIIDDAELGEETKRKIAIEKERLKSMQFSAKYNMMNSSSCNRNLLNEASVEVLGDAITGYIVNVRREDVEEAIAGIRFIWENIIQSITKVRSGDKGLCCILAHTMGLGKTFQVIAFLYAAMRSVDLGLKTALIVTPVNVLHNWQQEFMKWRPSELKSLRVFMLEDVPRERRAELLAKWRAKGGVFLIGYTAFRNLSLGKHVKDRHMARDICHALQDGPDILVCDEAHTIKNTRADTTQALKQVKSQRRIALTGSPLQNNLMEYYCVSYYFYHILYEQLKGFVQRMDMSVVKKDLPPKTVFVIAVKLSPLQRKLYKRFLEVHGFTSNTEKIRKSFFAGYQALAQVFMCLNGFTSCITEKPRNMNDSMHQKNEYGFIQKGWWIDLLRENNYKELDYSGKMVLLLDIITMCSDVGDKALVFSQSIPTLDLIELYLSRLPRCGKMGKFWKKGKDWYRLDGRTESSERQKLVERFNEPMNKRVKCTLISTRAGSLGINLYAANRVIIVDGSWNPTYDLQAIYRAWRYGQTKPVFAYRLMAHGTMEEKIYKRQVTKEGLAARVVDRQQVHRTISKEEMLHLFEFGDEEKFDTLMELSEENGNQNITCEVGKSLKQKMPLSHGSCSSDKLMESLLSKHHPRWITCEVFRKTLEWEEVQRVSLDESAAECKPVVPDAASTKPEPETIHLTQPKGIFRSHIVQRKCTNLAHLLTLRSQGTKFGCSTVCGECAQEISWEDLNRDNKMAR